LFRRGFFLFVAIFEGQDVSLIVTFGSYFTFRRLLVATWDESTARALAYFEFLLGFVRIGAYLKFPLER